MPLKECTLGVPSLGMAMDVLGPDGEPVPRGEVGELVCRQAVAEHDPRHLGRPGAVPGGVLVALAGAVGARRLGIGRRGRLLVPARPLGRHAEHRRQADRPGGVRVGRRRPSGRRRGLRRRRPRPGQGRGLLAVPGAAARRHAERRAGRGGARPRRPRAGQGVRARPAGVGGRPAPDPQRQDRAPRRPGRGAGRGAGRPLVAGEPGRARAVRPGQAAIRPGSCRPAP